MPRALRQTRNRDLFRAINAQIAEITAGLAIEGVLQGYICECSTIGCTGQIQLRPDVYARVMGAPSTYIVRPGHEDTAFESVVEATDNYVIVRARDD